MADNKTFIELVENSCRLYPKKTAIHEGDRKVSYRELWELSGRVYAALKKAGIGIEDMVMIRMDSAASSIITMIGVLRACAAFVITTSRYNDEQAGYQYADCGCKVLINDRVFANMLEERAADDFECAQEHAAAYVIYTSGSTEKPKGVKLERGALTLCSQTFFYQGTPLSTPDDRIALLAPLTFTAGMIVVNVSLTGGAELFAAPRETIIDPIQLKTFLFANRITRCFMTPSLYQTVHEFNPEMAVIGLSGEKLKQAGRDDLLLLNLYGQTESGYVLTAYGADHLMPVVPVGKPQTSKTRVWVANAQGEPADTGETGEICYDAPYFREYIGDPEKTNYARRDGSFHSGDLGKTLAGGNIVVLGRNDDMVKINGIRVEPSAIEAAIQKIYPVGQVAVRCTAEKTKAFICIYYTGDIEIDPHEARKRLSDLLPSVMLPTHFFHLDRIPVNQNGKMDLFSLPFPLEASSSEPADSPRGELEQQICDMVCEVMELSLPPGRETNLISLGLSSITALELIGRIEETYSVQFHLEEFMSCPDIAHISELAAGHGTNKPSGASDPQMPGAYFPLTKSQLGIFSECESNKHTVQYNIPGYCAFDRSEVDISRLRAMAEQLFAAHPALNLQIFRKKEIPESEWIDGCEVYQRIEDTAPVIQITYLDHELKGKEEKDFFQKKVVPFRMFGERLYHFEIVVTPRKLYLFHDVHHIISDGYSIRVLADDIGRLLRQEVPAAEVMSFREYAMIEKSYAQSDAAKKDEKYYEELLSGFRSFKYPYIMHDEGRLPHRIVEVKKIISDEEITRFCRANGFTQSSYFHSAILLTLYLLTREKPFIVTTYNGRTKRADKLMRTYGLMARSVPLVLKTDGEPGSLSPATLIDQIQQQIMQTCSRDSVIYSDLPLRTDVLFTYQGELAHPHINGYSVVDLAQETPKFPIMVEIRPDSGSFEIALSYDFALFTENDMGILLDSYLCMLGRLCRISVLHEASLTETDGIHLPKYSQGKSVCVRDGATWVSDFKKQAALHPDKCAVLAENGSYTYRELDMLSDKIAVYLTEHGVKPNSFVAVKMDRVKEYLPSVLGIHKCGAAYVPVDIEYPERRIDYILEDSGAMITLTREKADLLSAAPHIPFVPKTTPENTAYIIYTSGSTGEPKGTVIRHKALYNYLFCTVKEMQLTAECRSAVYASFSFDISAEGLYPPLMAGGTCCIVPSSCRKDMVVLEKYLAENRITSGCFPTQIGQMIGRNGTVDLDYICLIGEKMTQIPDITGRVYNSYGPTEFAVACTCFTIDKDRRYSDIPIGKPMYNTSVLIADPFGNLLPQGAIGELYLAGIQLADGYHNKPGKTAQAFTFLREYPGIMVYRTGDLGRYMQDGNLSFCGRIDRQIKRRGYRIEPGEIETTAKSLPEIKEAVVLQKEEKLILYYTLRQENGIGQKEAAQKIRAGLEAVLPDYMIPDACVYLEKMPLTPNGKIDVSKLPEPVWQSGSYAAPENDAGRFICDKMSKILGIDKIGMTDDFFAMGGNSLNAVLLAETLGDDYEIRDIYQGRTPAGILKAGSQKKRICSFEKQSSYPLTEEQKKYFYDDKRRKILDNVNRSFSNVPWLFLLPEDTDLEELRTMLIMVVDHHPYLKVRYVKEEARSPEPREQFAARRDDSIPARVSLIHMDKLDKNTLIQPFNLLGDDDLYRAALYDVQGKEKYLFLDFSHILIDGESFHIMCRDLLRLMEGKPLLPETATGYDAALEEQIRREEERKKNEAYYRELLKGCTRNTTEWIDSRKDPAIEKLRDIRFTDSRNQMDDILLSRTVFTKKSSVRMKEIRKKCQSLSITENMLFHAVFACLIGECNGLSEAFYSTVIHNRHNTALDHTVTMLCRTVPIYLRVRENMLKTEAFTRTLRDVVSNANLGGLSTFSNICIMNGVNVPSISMIYRDRPVDEELVPGWKQVEVDSLSSVEDLMVKIYYYSDGSLFLNFDAYVSFSLEELKQMAERFDEILCGM